MPLDFDRIRTFLKGFDFNTLFIEELGWDRHTARLSVQAGENMYTLEGVAEKRGVQIFICQPGPDGMIPDYATRHKIEKQITKSAYEHLIIFIDADRTMQIWQWVSRQPGQPAAYREHHYHARHHSGDSLIQKLEAITFTLNEEEGLTLTGVVFKLHDAFYRDRVTKKFYDHFKKEHGKFLDFIQGITEQGDREWYASLMLNRLMFVYFIQRKGFLDGDMEYLKNRLKIVQERVGKDKFLTFYRYFLVRLFHEGFAQQPAQRMSDLEELLGKVPYLDGGLFDLHELEEKHPDIDVPDKAFERLFGFFDQYEWHLDTRPLSNDREINPDVLGYIFEKYINQKQMGAYYTKEDITEYISKNTIIPFLFDAAEKKCAIAFQPDSALWQLFRHEPDRFIFPAVQKGVIDKNGDVIPLPDEIEKGIHNVKERGGWNHPADPEYALPTETWREHVARRQRCLEVREKLSSGQVHKINDLITYNLDIRQFAQDVIANCEGPELLRAFYKAISTVTVLDPTCGSGAFLFAALNILEPLYEGCLDRMQAFLDDFDRSGERHRPEKFSDFRRTLAEIDKHPNRLYFILKSIIVNNLYGVDIMQEAVEICKLRLFLKLVAQVDKVKHLEPLPDIDFNIRAGNTLVGFASLDAAKKSMEGNWIKLAELPKIQEEAELVDKAFNKFHEMQTSYGMDSHDFTEAKKEIRNRLNKLDEKLNKYLARVYNVDSDEERVFVEWQKNHNPFHWFSEFYGIMHEGGFDVVIGNPPYVEYSKVRNDYGVIDLKTEACGNLYAFTAERSFSIIADTGRFGLIVPLSITTTKRMRPLQELLLKSNVSLWLSHYDVYPTKLFEGAKQRLTIVVLSNVKKKAYVFTTRYNRWRPEERASLFHTLHYNQSFYNNRISSIPKLWGKVDLSILEKLNNKNPAKVISDSVNPSFFVHRIPYNYIKAFDFIPYFWNEIDGQKKSEDYKPYRTLNPSDTLPLLAVINSNLFFWWWYCHFEGYHCGKHEIFSFPIGLNEMAEINRSRLEKLSEELMRDIQNNKNRKICNYRTTGKVEYDEFFPRTSKHIIDQIDYVLGDHFRLDHKEIDYIVNFDVKYRATNR